jgi:hypothetical protein
MLDEDIYTTVSEIGDAESISKSYVSRILRLALLSPDIIEAILAGRTDQSLTLKRMEQPSRAFRTGCRSRFSNRWSRAA